MTYGMRFQWVDEEPPGGPVSLYDDRGMIVALCHRGFFEEDPDGFMDALERHCDSNVAGHGWTLALPVAVGEDRSPVPSRIAARARRGGHLASVMVLPITGCAAVAALFARLLAPAVGA